VHRAREIVHSVMSCESRKRFELGRVFVYLADATANRTCACSWTRALFAATAPMRSMDGFRVLLSGMCMAVESDFFNAHRGSIE